MISIEAKDLLTLPQAARSLPGKVHPATLWRWSAIGRQGHRLETLKIGKQRFTTREALQRFLVASDPRASGEAETVPLPSKSEADKYCEAEGL